MKLVLSNTAWMGFWLSSMFSISFHTCLLASSSSSWPFTFFWVCSVAIFRHILDWLIIYHPIQKKKEFKENFKKILSCLSPVLTQEKSRCYNEHMKRECRFSPSGLIDLYSSLKSSLAAKTHFLPPCWAFTSSPLLFWRTAIRVYKRETKLAPLLLPQSYLACSHPLLFPVIWSSNSWHYPSDWSWRTDKFLRLCQIEVSTQETGWKDFSFRIREIVKKRS